MLRFQPEIGPGLDQPLARYLSLPVVPTQLGFDPRLQFVHADDATGALAAAVRNPVRGPVNVAPDGTISLTQILRLAGAADAADPAPARRPGARPARPPARRRRPLQRRDPAAALRARLRQRAAERGGRLRARASTRRRRCATSSPRQAPAGGSSACRIRATRVGAAAGDEPLMERRATARRPRDRHRGRRRSRASCAGCAAGSRTGSTRWRRPSARRPRCRGAARLGRADAPPDARRLPRGRVGLRRGVRRGRLPAVRVPLRRLVAGRGRRCRNVPAHGRAMLVSNHSGSLFPFDASMMTLAIMKEHPLPRWPAPHGPQLGLRAARS